MFIKKITQCGDNLGIKALNWIKHSMFKLVCLLHEKHQSLFICLQRRIRVQVHLKKVSHGGAHLVGEEAANDGPEPETRTTRRAFLNISLSTRVGRCRR